MGAVDNFIFEKEGVQQRILMHLHSLLHHHHNLSPTMKYKIPFYEGNKWICYLNPIKKGGVELAFIKGNLLSNNHGLLLAKNRKQVRGFEIYSIESCPDEAIETTLLEAIEIDRRKHLKQKI